jgi:hypothetical protein
MVKGNYQSIYRNYSEWLYQGEEWLLLKDVFEDSPHLENGKNTDDYECKVSEIIYISHYPWIKDTIKCKKNFLQHYHIA